MKLDLEVKRMGVTEEKSEDIMVLFGVNPNVSKINVVLRELDNFFSQKQAYDGTDRYNFIAFESNGPIYFEDFLFEPEFIIDALKDLTPQLVAPNIAGGIMTAITFIIDVFKIVGGKVFRLLVITDRTTPKMANVEVLQALMNQVIDFPFIIDFIRIGTDDPREDLNVMKFAKKNGGEVFFAKNEKELGKILPGLLKKKMEKRSEADKYYISPENEPFFENLAEDLWMVEPEDAAGKRCQICGESTGELVKCSKCDPVVHAHCMAQWAKMSNIGIPQVFRCMNCYNLLRLPKHFIDDVQSGRYQRQIQMEAADQNALLREKEKSMKPQLKTGADPLAGMGGGVDDGWGSGADEDFVMQDDSSLEIQFCSNCGALNFPESIRCSKCGQALR